MSRAILSESADLARKTDLQRNVATMHQCPSPQLRWMSGTGIAKPGLPERERMAYFHWLRMKGAHGRPHYAIVHPSQNLDLPLPME